MCMYVCGVKRFWGVCMRQVEQIAMSAGHQSMCINTQRGYWGCFETTSIITTPKPCYCMVTEEDDVQEKEM